MQSIAATNPFTVSSGSGSGKPNKPGALGHVDRMARALLKMNGFDDDEFIGALANTFGSSKPDALSNSEETNPFQPKLNKVG